MTDKERDILLGKYLTLSEFCTCTKTYQKYAEKIAPFPKNPESLVAIADLNTRVIDPIIDRFGREKFHLTYGFCSSDLKRYLARKDPLTGQKNGRVTPSLDQHMAMEKNRNGKYYCDRLGAACDFFIEDVSSNTIIDWILAQKLPFDSLYFYGEKRPLHISHGPQQKRAIWGFTPTGQPTRQNVRHWLEKT
ncbi:MAG: hypothetical protein AAGA60_14665 [Cyanobacteria bacterium P01_E01_bin.42]